MNPVSVLIQRTWTLVEGLWHRWERGGGTGVTLIIVFLGTLLAIEARNLGLVPAPWDALVPESRFSAITVAFTAFLVFEVIALAFGLVDSVARVAGKQLEIFSLILLRKAFTELKEFEAPLSWEALDPPLLHLLADGIGALLIFGIAGWYASMQRHRPIVRSEQEQTSFITAKKAVALLLLAGILAVGLHAGWQRLVHGEAVSFFNAVFTLFIFTDVLVVLVSLQYNPDYRIVFRNSGFALSTVMIRLALAGPPFFNALLGVLAGLFAVGVTWVYNRFAPELDPIAEVPGGTEDALLHPPAGTGGSPLHLSGTQLPGETGPSTP